MDLFLSMQCLLSRRLCHICSFMRVFFCLKLLHKIHREPRAGLCCWEGKSAPKTERMALLMTFSFLGSILTFYLPSCYMNRKL